MKRKRKPDLLAVLAIVVGIGVVASGLAQGMLTTSDSRVTQLAQGTLQQDRLASPINNR